MEQLDAIGNKYRTDKASWHHGYLNTYSQYLEPYRNRPIALIEAGVGGYQYPDRGGESARMWYEYFTHPEARIITTDLHHKTGIINDRTEFWQGDQCDSDLWRAILSRTYSHVRRVFIDDASHINPLTIRTFEIVWPLLRSGDLYFCEDLETSYWSDHGYEGGENGGAMSYFCGLAHQVNYEYLPAHTLCHPDVAFVHFYKKLVVIKKL